MDMLPLVLLILFPIVLIGIILVIRKLSTEQPNPVAGAAGAESNQEPTSPPGPPVNQPDLETMRLAVEQMDTEQIENLLDMGATLKPGTEGIFRQELAKRQAFQDSSEE